MPSLDLTVDFRAKLYNHLQAAGFSNEQIEALWQFLTEWIASANNVNTSIGHEAVTLDIIAPWQKVFEELFKWWVVNRETMSQENRNRWDNLLLVMSEGWHNWWIDQGWPGKKV